MGNILYDVLVSGLASVADYLTGHVLTCLIPAFFIAGAIGAFIKKDAILKYFGVKTKKRISYALASVSGAVLAVCSCTILPLFAGIYKKGSGIGPATTFLYSGPAINILAIVYTAQVLGYDLGAARAVAAISMSIVVGLIMATVFKKHDEELNSKDKKNQKIHIEEDKEENGRPFWTLFSFFALLIAILVIGASKVDWILKLAIIYILILGVVYILIYYFTRDEVTDWGYETWDLTKKILPILIAGTFIVGIIAYFLPPESFKPYLGGNSLGANFLAAIIGAILYMPTLLEVPIIGKTFGYSQGVMGGGPALSLLLAGPAISLPNMIVLYRIMGAKKTGVFVGVVILISTIVGFIYGNTIT